ncbi:MAG: hypothetical protein ACE5JX_06140 [Acidobacteriota bacterium]
MPLQSGWGDSTASSAISGPSWDKTFPTFIGDPFVGLDTIQLELQDIAKAQLWVLTPQPIG